MQNTDQINTTVTVFSECDSADSVHLLDCIKENGLLPIHV